jgi:hypothetical protein
MPCPEVLALALDGDFLVAPHIQLPLRERLLIKLAALGRWRDGIKHPALRDARLHMLGHQVIATARHGDARILRLLASRRWCRGCLGC